MIHFPTDVHHDLPTDYKQKFGHQERKRDDLTLKDRQERKRYGCFRRLHAWTRLLAVCVDVVAPGSRSQFHRYLETLEALERERRLKQKLLRELSGDWPRFKVCRVACTSHGVEGLRGTSACLWAGLRRGTG